jgi:hypothetical protein
MTTATNSIPITAASATRRVRTGPVSSGHRAHPARTGTGSDLVDLRSTRLGGTYVTLPARDVPTTPVVGSYVSTGTSPTIFPLVRTGYVTLSASEMAKAAPDTVGDYVTVRAAAAA